jgi:hypothetical protein
MKTDSPNTRLLKNTRNNLNCFRGSEIRHELHELTQIHSVAGQK